MPLWKEKARAFAIHFVVTACVGMAAAALIFLVWFPAPFQDLAGGVKLFLLVTGCDLVLGPLLSIVVYNSRKTRLALTIDYTVIAVLQLGALTYGIHNIWEARPVFLVFAKDQIEVATAGEILSKELDAAKNPKFQSLPVWGPVFAATRVAREDRQDALFTAAMEGRDVAARPKFYVEYDTQLEDIRKVSRPLSDITAKHPNLSEELDQAVRRSGRPASELRWLPVKYKDVFWTALIDVKTGYPVEYLSADAY